MAPPSRWGHAWPVAAMKLSWPGNLGDMRDVRARLWKNKLVPYSIAPGFGMEDSLGARIATQGTQRFVQPYRLAARCLPHGHGEAVRIAMRRLSFDKLIHGKAKARTSALPGMQGEPAASTNPRTATRQWPLRKFWHGDHKCPSGSSEPRPASSHKMTWRRPALRSESSQNVHCASKGAPGVAKGLTGRERR